MVVPALIYFLLNPQGATARGWAIPMATDIAFALGILAMVGRRAPMGLKVFLTAVAIIDDIGAVLVIAAFYTAEIHYGWLAAGVALWLVLVAFNYMGIDQPLPYFLVGAVIWFAFLHSGVHATIAGILVAFTIPARARTKPLDFVNFARRELENIEENEVPGAHTLEDPSQQKCAMRIQEQARHVSAPLQRLEHGIQPFTTYVVLPLFALANAGVTVRGYDVGELLLEPVSIGIFLGLIVGKTLGISVSTWLAVKARLASLPENVNWGHVIGAGVLGGVGFTMSLFISNLAFRAGILQVEAKLAILVASTVAGVAGYLLLRWVTGRSPIPAEADVVTESA
jgi:NhaA family Na+:H+ antiporter